ncbi:MAG: hypothetical protein AB7O65_09145 [Candidatus Korobacteraceae bacterium]
MNWVTFVAGLVLFAVPGSLYAQQEFTRFNFNIGGGIGVPLNPTGAYAGISGNFVSGAGYNFDSHHSVVGQFMWHGLPPNRRVLVPISGVDGSINLYSLTANYKLRKEWSQAGVYLIGGGGWYYRYAKLEDYTVVPGTVCQPVYDWWGFYCEEGLVPVDNTLAYRGLSSIGGNAGMGFTVSLGESGLKFYMEARYHYAPHSGVPTTAVPVTFGFAW